MNNTQRKATRLITVSAVMTALSVVSVYLGSVFPTGQLGFAAISSLFVIAAVVECGLKGGIFVYIGSAALTLLLVPDKSTALLFALFFGYYPVIKSLAERPKSRVLEWIIKLCLLNAALSVLLFLFKLTIFDYSVINGSTPLIYLLANIVFVLYDIGVSRLIFIYVNKISKRIKHE